MGRVHPGTCPRGDGFEGGSKWRVGQTGNKKEEGFSWKRKHPCGCSPIPAPRPNTLGFFSFQGQAQRAPCGFSTQRGTLQAVHRAHNILLPERFLFVGGNKTAANVSSVKGNLCWCHGQGITSAYSYRMYRLQRIPSITYSKNQGEKKY